MSIKQYKLRDLNKNPILHNQVFVLRDDCIEMLQKFVVAAVEAGADQNKLMEIIDEGEKDDSVSDS
jgi:hypothetical protein